MSQRAFARTTATDRDETKIAALAYQLWLERGCPIGSDQEDWFRAEGMLKSRSEDTVEELALDWDDQWDDQED